jgi:RimK family alpha-L-glutamate ligase
MSDEVRVGVLSLHNSKETKAICNAVADLGHQPRWLRAENLALTATAGGADLLPDVDVVVNRLLLPSTERPLTALGLVSAVAAGTPVVNPAEAVATATHKFAAAAHLAEAGHPVPATALRIGANRIEELAVPADEADRDPPAFSLATSAGTRVFKHPVGTHGDATRLLNPGGDAPQLRSEAQGLIQELVETPADGHEDVRVYVVGGEVIGAMRRHAPDDDWRTNVARGGRVRAATEALPDEVLELARDATDTLGLDVAGVDIIEGVDGWYVLEVNVTAGFKGFFDATGISPAPHIAKLAIERAGGVVDPERATELATRLDDSVPACKPDLDRSPEPEQAVIGYTEEVRIAGNDGAKTVVAKADTGATRTSIDLELAGEVGAGPILDTKEVKGGDDSSPRPIVPVDVRIGDYTHQLEVNVRDRSHLSHDVLLGRDVLEHYSVRVRHGVADDTKEDSYYAREQPNE